MEIEIIAATPNPAMAISLAAGTCYAKDNVSRKRVKTCHDSGHLSVFEHAGFTAKVSGISRACSHQLVRHRLCSFCQESQRYVKYDFTGDDWYVKPDAFDGVVLGLAEEVTFDYAMQAAAYAYRYAVDAGIRPEDARYLLPEATKTTVTMTANVRELYHILDVRDDSHAQWEIRALSKALKASLAALSDEWRFLVELHG